MKLLVIGNGSVGMAVAAGLLEKDSALDITIVGPATRPFSASMAAAAMLNSFAELEPGSLDSTRDRVKFEASQQSARMWSAFVEKNDIPSRFLRMGTVILSNSASDVLDDENFAAIKGYLDKYEEPYQLVDPTTVRGYKPADHVRAGKALFLEREGWVTPDAVLYALEDSLRKRGVTFIDASVRALDISNGKTSGIVMEDGSNLSADIVVLANGSSASELYNQSAGVDRHMILILHGVGCTIGLKSESIACDYVIRTPNRGGACGIYHAPYAENTFVCGASNLVTNAPETHARLTSIYNLTAGCMEQINKDHFKSQLTKVNVGYRPTSADIYPAIGWLNDNTYTVTGTKRDGYHFAPWLAEKCAAQIVDKTVDSEFLQMCDPFRQPYNFGTPRECARRYAKHKMSALAQHGYRDGHTSSTEDLLQLYEQRVMDYFDQNGLLHGVATEMVEPLIGGHIEHAKIQAAE